MSCVFRSLCVFSILGLLLNGLTGQQSVAVQLAWQTADGDSSRSNSADTQTDAWTSLKQEIATLQSIVVQMHESQSKLQAQLGMIDAKVDMLAGSFRLWRSTNGKTIVAALVKIDDDKVVLTRDGREAAVELRHLSEPDRNYVASWKPNQTKEWDYLSRQADLTGLGVIR